MIKNIKYRAKLRVSVSKGDEAARRILEQGEAGHGIDTLLVHFNEACGDGLFYDHKILRGLFEIVWELLLLILMSLLVILVAVAI